MTASSPPDPTGVSYRLCQCRGLNEEPQDMRLAERHVMSGTAMVARNSGDG
jgi:hypothetical protein